jgi:hypothetical protein
MVRRNGVVIMLAQLEQSGMMRPNRPVDPEGGAWDAYVWIENADALNAEFRSKGVHITRDICDLGILITGPGGFVVGAVGAALAGGRGSGR